MHNRDDLPLLLAGGAGGAVKSGRHVRYDGDAFSDLHLWMLHNAGAKAERVADSKGVLKGLA